MEGRVNEQERASRRAEVSEWSMSPIVQREEAKSQEAMRKEAGFPETTEGEEEEIIASLSFRWFSHKSRQITGLANRSFFSLSSSPSTFPLRHRSSCAQPECLHDPYSFLVVRVVRIPPCS